MAKINRRGFYPLFTTLGLLMALMVVAMSISWGAARDSGYNAHTDRLSWLRVNSAVENVRAIVAATLRDSFYSAVLEVGRIEDSSTTNKYLNYSASEGWAQIVSDIKFDVSSSFNSGISTLADYSEGGQNVFLFEDGINLTLGDIDAASLDVVETADGLSGVVGIPLTVTNRYQGWQATIFEGNFTIPIPVRLKDIYERACEFHDNYGDYASWTFTGALYARAYLNAYFTSSGPLLKEAHYDFDPVATVLFGDLDAFNDFVSDPESVLDIGAIPAATWLAEWQFLSEPSFLPAGFDMSSEDAEQAAGAIQNNYRMGEIEEEVCADAADAEDCRAIYDVSELEERVDFLDEKKDEYDDLLSDIDSWLRRYDTTKYSECKSCSEEYSACKAKCGRNSKCLKKCKKAYESCVAKYDDQGRDKKAECQEKALNTLFGTGAHVCDPFRDTAAHMLDDIIESMGEIDEDGCLDTIQEPQDEYVDDLDVPSQIDSEFDNNDETYGFDQTDDYCVGSGRYIGDLEKVLDTKLTASEIADSKCQTARIGDCVSDTDCLTGGDCDIRCAYPSCPRSGYSYQCVGDLSVTKPPRVEDCEVCDDDGDCSDEEDYISQCTCRCRPSITLLMRINSDLIGLRIYVLKAYGAVNKTYDALEPQLERRQHSDQLMEEAQRLGVNELGYDVFSRVDPILVKYDQGGFPDGKECYYAPTFADRDSGVCGDSLESVGLYTIQIAAAALATLFSGGAAAPIMEYAINFFPVVFESEVRYNLTETLIDDGNRVMLKDMGGAYTYAPFEFEIYKNKEFRIGSKTADRLLIYIYLPAVKNSLQRILEGIASPECTGEACD